MQSINTVYMAIFAPVTPPPPTRPSTVTNVFAPS